MAGAFGGGADHVAFSHVRHIRPDTEDMLAYVLGLRPGGVPEEEKKEGDEAEEFDDIFVPIARDGAGVVEVQVRLHKALAALARTGDQRFVENAHRQSEQALERAALAMDFPNDIGRARAAAAMVGA